MLYRRIKNIAVTYVNAGARALYESVLIAKDRKFERILLPVLMMKCGRFMCKYDINYIIKFDLQVVWVIWNS